MTALCPAIFPILKDMGCAFETVMKFPTSEGSIRAKISEHKLADAANKVSLHQLAMSTTASVFVLA